MRIRSLAVALLLLGAAGCDRPPVQADPQGRYVSAYTEVHECLGNVDNATTTRVEGWSWDRTLARPYDRVLVAAGGQVIARGHGGGLRPDVAAARPDVTSGATGFVAEGDFQGLISVYGVRDDGTTICLIGGGRVQ